MNTYGVIGYPLTHTFSPRYFAQKFQSLKLDSHQYITGEFDDLKKLNDWIITQHIQGFNVTIPYKQQILPYLDFIQPAALTIKAVNCVKVLWKSESNYELVGFNTDIIGFRQSLEPLLKPYHKQALILGTGGAASAVAYVLRKLQIPFLFVSRNPNKSGEIAYSEVSNEILSQHHIIINTTPLGMYPNVDAAPPLPFTYITSQHLLYDLIYNPAETLFLKQGAAHGAMVKNGYEMLCLQAEASWNIWNE
ncbi:MAG: shikimate dehydrogenase [Flavobacteriales bacterium]|nr:shikimate dehydrogenase [Flavobacteriales bacterium]